jgi:hypothetical protein
MCCYSFDLRLGYKIIVFSMESHYLQKRERHYWVTKLSDISLLIRALGPCTCTMSPGSYVIWINQPANLCLRCDHSVIPSCNLYMAMTFPQAPLHVLYMLRIYVPISHSMWRNGQPCSSVCVVSYKSSVHHWVRYYERSHLFFLLSLILLIGWQLSIWNCCKPLFSLLYNFQLPCCWRLALSTVVRVFPRPFLRILLPQGCLLLTRYA